MRGEETKTLAIGAGSGVVATLCCTLPLVLLALGLGSAATAFQVSMYRTYFLALSLVFIAAALGYQHKRNPSCPLQSRVKYVALALAGYLLIYIALLYAVVPAVSPYVYGRYL